MVISTALALAACATGQQRRGLRPVADPSAVIARELAFARAAQEKGQWTAFRDFAADDAVMFVPEPVGAQDWLRRQSDPPQAVQWQPHQVWSSCDGTLAATKGAWQRPDGSVGYFTTVWKRTDNQDEYEWVMDQGDVLQQPLPAPQMIDAEVADCGSRPATPSPLGRAGGNPPGGVSRDGTLAWSVETTAEARTVRVSYWDGSEWQDAISERVTTR